MTRFRWIVRTACVCALAVGSSLQAQDVGIRRQMQETQSNYATKFEELRAARQRKEKILQELHQGFFCSECRRSKSEIEAGGSETFAAHLKSVHGRAIPMSAKEISEKAAELDKDIDQIIAQLVALRGQYDQLQSDANRTERQAANSAQDASRAEQQRQLDSALRAYRDRQAEAKREEEARGVDKDDDQKREANQDADSQVAAQRAREETQARREETQARREEAKERRENAALARDEQAAADREARQEAENEARAAREAQERETEARAQAAKEAIQRAKAERVADLVDSGVAVGPGNGGDSTKSSTAQQLLDVASAGNGVADATKRLLSDDRPDLAARVQLITQNAADELKLIDRVTEALPGAMTALLTGDVAAEVRVESTLNGAEAKFAEGADQRARAASPEYNLLRSSQQARGAIANPGGTRTPSGGSTTELLVPSGSSPVSVASTPSGTHVDPHAIFESTSYAEEVSQQPWTLYRVTYVVGGVSYPLWTRAKPTDEQLLRGTISIVVPAHTLLRHGRPIGALDDVIYVDDTGPTGVGR